jgi:hypothetical protein
MIDRATPSLLPLIVSIQELHAIGARIIRTYSGKRPLNSEFWVD